MSRRTDSLRLFVAAYPPAAIARDMLAALAPLDLPSGRDTPPEQLHLTLAFIGDTPVSELESVIESVRRSCSGLGRFTLTPRRLVTLPHRPPPRLVALETDAPATLLELVRRLTLRLARNPRQRPTDRFLPHFTLRRFDHAPDRSRWDAPPAPLDLPAATPQFLIDRVHLMRSVLKPTGAEHREAAVFELAPSA